MVFELSSNCQFSSFLGGWDQRYDGGRVVRGMIECVAAAANGAGGGEWI